LHQNSFCHTLKLMSEILNRPRPALGQEGKADVALGLQFGDEGKGLVVERLIRMYGYDIVVRFNGGPNAGHTLVMEDGSALALHQIPCGVTIPEIQLVLGNGMYVDPVELMQNELPSIADAGIELSKERLAISGSAHLIMPHHISLDRMRESGDAKQGSTKRGIAFVAADKYLRRGVRAEQILQDPKSLYQLAFDGLEEVNRQRREAGLKPESQAKIRQKAKLWAESAEATSGYITDTGSLLRNGLRNGAKVLGEGAQATGLDIEDGTYPSVTSSHPSVGGFLNGSGLNHTQIGGVIGVFKSNESRVGDGPFITRTPIQLSMKRGLPAAGPGILAI
jgi:adenylosuccinate synthase